jgi:hypothetical protein
LPLTLRTLESVSTGGLRAKPKARYPERTHSVRPGRGVLAGGRVWGGVVARTCSQDHDVVLGGNLVHDCEGGRKCVGELDVMSGLVERW